MPHLKFQMHPCSPLLYYGSLPKYIKGNLKHSEASVHSRKNKSAINLFHPTKLKAFKIKHFPRPCFSDMLHAHKVNLLIKHEYAIPLHMTMVFWRDHRLPFAFLCTETSHRVGAYANICCFFLSKPGVTPLECFILGKSVASPVSIVFTRYVSLIIKGLQTSANKQYTWTSFYFILMIPSKVRVLGCGCPGH